MNFPYNKLSDDLRKKIERKGTEKFNRLTKSKLEAMNAFFEPYGLEYVIPNEEFIVQNIEDGRFALRHLPLARWAHEKLLEKVHFLEFQLESLKTYKEKGFDKPSRHFLFFHEKNGGWSIVNLFNNNVSLWTKLMTQHLEGNYTGNLDEFVEWYFSSKHAMEDLIRAMVERAVHYENIIKKTWGGGTQNEDDFINELLLKHKIDSERIKKFSGGGNIVDLVGIDLSLKCGKFYIPIQVKSSQQAALNNIPKGGLGVFPYKGTFYYSEKKNEVPQPIEKFLLEECQ